MWGLCGPWGPWGPSLQSFEVLKILGGLEVVFEGSAVFGRVLGSLGSLEVLGDPWGVWTWSRVLGSLGSLRPLGASSGLQEASSGRVPNSKFSF